MIALSSKSWKTTSAGVLTIAGAVANAAFNWQHLNEALVMVNVTQILSGIGLLLARDNDKTSEDVGVSTKPQNVNPPVKP